MLGFGDQNFADQYSDNRPIAKPDGEPLTEKEPAARPTDTHSAEDIV